MDKHRVLVIDDHSIVRHGLAALLAKEKDLAICGEAGSYEEAEAAIAELKPDILIVDIVLKDRNGLDLIREARETNPSLKALVLSMHDESEYANRALRAGAQGYVMKENADATIVDAIRTILRGDVFVSPETAARILKQYATPPGEQTPAQGVAALTDRELEIFERIGKGLSTRKIAEQLGLSPRTVEVHRAHIKHKLQCEDAAQLVREAVRWVEGRKG